MDKDKKKIIAGAGIASALALLWLLLLRKGEAAPPPEEPPVIPPVEPEPEPDDLLPPPSGKSASISFVRLTFSYYFSFKPVYVVPNNSDFYVVTDIVRLNKSTYGTKRWIRLKDGVEVPTMANLGMDGGDRDWDCVRIRIYNEPQGEKLYDQYWEPADVKIERQW